ncbi:MAG: LysR family transcriptional regulator [Bacillaceae bacterium]
MELRDLNAFIDVANHKSFTKAAEHSYLTQPSLSKSIKRLEEELDVELFDRSTRHVRMTEAGKIVYQQGQKTIAALAQINTLLDELKNVDTGELKIGIPPIISTLFFPKIATTLHSQYPKVKLQLVELDTKSIEQLVANGEIDLGIVVLPTSETTFTIYPFIQDKFVLYIHETHTLATKNTISLCDLKDENFITFSKEYTLHDYVIEKCEGAGFMPTIAYESSQLDLIMELVSSNLGIALLPKAIHPKPLHENIKMIPIDDPTFVWQLAIITKKGGYHSFVLKALLNLLEETTSKG